MTGIWFLISKLPRKGLDNYMECFSKKFNEVLRILFNSHRREEENKYRYKLDRTEKLLARVYQSSQSEGRELKHIASFTPI